MFNIKKFPIIISTLVILSTILVYIEYIINSITLIVLFTIIQTTIIALTLTAFVSLISKTEKTIDVADNLENELNEELKLISNTTEISEYAWSVINREVTKLKRYNLSFIIKYNMTIHKYYLVTECTMQVYTKMSLSDALSDIVAYKIKDSDIVLYKNKSK